MNDEVKKSLNGKKGNKLAPLIFLASFALIMLIVFAIGMSFISTNNSNDPDVHFKNCKLLASNCTDIVTCGLNVYCGDGEYKDCRIYDCENSFGIFTKGLNDEVVFDNVMKQSNEEVAAVRENCGGTMQILSQECKGNQTEIKLKITPKGQCEIESIATVFDNIGTWPNTFSTVGDNTYSIISNTCEKLNKVIPVGKGGVDLDLKQEGV
jgi:hypothetical protein